MGGKLVRTASGHAEDLALAGGALLLAGGLGWRVGWWAALVVLGVVLLVLGVWMSREGGA